MNPSPRWRRWRWLDRGWGRCPAAPQPSRPPRPGAPVAKAAAKSVPKAAPKAARRGACTGLSPGPPRHRWSSLWWPRVVQPSRPRQSRCRKAVGQDARRQAGWDRQGRARREGRSWRRPRRCPWPRGARPGPCPPWRWRVSPRRASRPCRASGTGADAGPGCCASARCQGRCGTHRARGFRSQFAPIPRAEAVRQLQGRVAAPATAPAVAAAPRASLTLPPPAAEVSRAAARPAQWPRCLLRRPARRPGPLLAIPRHRPNCPAPRPRLPQRQP
jgi:hypothetical protein